MKFCPNLYEISTIINKDWNEDWINGISQIRIANEKCFDSFKEQHVFEKATIHSFDEALIELQTSAIKIFQKWALMHFDRFLKHMLFKENLLSWKPHGRTSSDGAS